MEINRIQIEGGFLNGFDLSLTSGLNVIIGARGTGKTTVIELIRYALNAKSHTLESKSRSISHAQAVLEGGEVTITINESGEEFVVTRGAEDDPPQATNKYAAPIILSQTEIETLGLSESGRLTLLDDFIADRHSMNADEATNISAIRAVYKDITALENEVSALADDLSKLAPLSSQLTELEKELSQLQGGSDVITNKQNEVSRLGERSTHLLLRETALFRFEKTTSAWFQALSDMVIEDLGVDSWSGAPSDDPLSGLREIYQDAINNATETAEQFRLAGEKALTRRNLIANNRIAIEKEARAIRSELDKLVEGTGALSRQITSVRSQIAQLQSRNSLLAERRVRLKALRERRDEKFSELLRIRERRYKRRAEIAREITAALRPHIRVDVDQSAQYNDYAQAIASTLRGTGMKYNDLAIKLAENVSPGELIEMVDGRDFISLADLIQIPAERAARLIGNLRESGLSEIITCSIEDNVRLSLLDGMEHKDISTLSAGQRCTVILSIVLRHTERTLIIDQPEDHLDNAFITSTVIKALKARKSIGQVILSTHNANIPVLGNADLVVELTSDGRNGFIQVCKPLDHPDAVVAITNVMEGGFEAFRSRADFYNNQKI